MEILKKLRTDVLTPPAYAATLKQFPLKTVAAEMGVTPMHLANVLSGYRKPGKVLNQTLIDLVIDIEDALEREAHAHK